MNELVAPLAAKEVDVLIGLLQRLLAAPAGSLQHEIHPAPGGAAPAGCRTPSPLQNQPVQHEGTHLSGRRDASVRFTGGCTLGPDFKRPQPPANAYSHAIPAAGPTHRHHPRRRRRRRLVPPVQFPGPRAARDQALAGNPNLEAARHGLLAAQYELKAVAGSQLPQIDATGQVGRAHINGSFLYAPTNYISVTGNRFGLGPTLAYNVDVFGGTRRQIESQQRPLPLRVIRHSTPT